MSLRIAYRQDGKLAAADMYVFFYFLSRCGLLAGDKYRHGPVAVREKRVAGEIAAWNVAGLFPGPWQIAKTVQAFCIEQIFQHIITGLIDVGIDSVSSEIPGA